MSDSSAGAEQMAEYTLNEFYFDTIISIRFDAGENGQELADGCRKICDEIQHTFSRTDEGSELYAVNHRTGNRVRVSLPLAELVQAGLDAWEMSDGKFDITVAPLSDLWDFKSEDASVPDAGKIEEALACVDASKVHVVYEEAAAAQTETDSERQAFLVFDSDRTMIDLGALVKGYAADRISAYLKANGVKSGLINLGGNVLAIGTKSDGSKWKIGIQKPFDTGTVDTVEVEDQSVVSSGVYERYFEQDGVIWHHILDPDTGYSVENGLWGVSIICDSSLTGDLLSTTCLAIGREKAEEIIKSLDIDVTAIFIDDRCKETKIVHAP